jgi:CheY-like chemotaxis protein
MHRILYIHWHEQESAERAARIRDMGYLVDNDPVNVPGFRSAFRKDPSDLVVIDLSRLPSHGREVAVWLTDTRGTAHIPLIFLDGAAEKVRVTRERLPHAAFATWDTLERDIQRALRKPPRPVPTDHKFRTQPMAAYSGTPLPKKLGITESTRVVVLNGPADFTDILGELPAKTRLLKSLRAKCDLMIWFPRDYSDFVSRLHDICERVPHGGLWIAWRKKSAGLKTDLSQNTIREMAIAAGLVDYKVCSIDSTWSGLKFAMKRSPNHPPG